MRIKITILAFLTLLPLFLAAQMINTEFGMNRVQFHRDFESWSEYESPNFVAYWYGEGRNVGQAVVQFAENDFREIQSILEYRMNRRIEIIVYVDITDMKQSNIGSETAFMSSTGQTKIVGNKMFVYFNGDHNHLRKQVREGIASVFINSMLFGSSLQEIVQNAVMMNLPDWFKDGLTAYCGEVWSPELDNQLRDIILQEDFKGFERFATENPKLAGHSMWYYISENYGKSTVSNLVYLTRINRSVESGLLYVLGNSYQSILGQWMIYYKERYKREVKEFEAMPGEPLKVRNKHKLPMSQLVLSPDGKKVAYVSNEIGRAKVYVQDVATGERKRIFKVGYRNVIQATDYGYPMLAWSPDNQNLAIVYEKYDVAYLRLYNTTNDTHVTEPVDPQFQRVNSIDFLEPNTLVFSATTWGFSDLFLYSINTRQSSKLTSDFWDDLDARVVKLRDRRGILFASNRQTTSILPAKMDTILPVNTFDLFWLDLENRSKELARVTNTPLSNERQPVAIDTTWFGYLGDESGIVNRSTGYLEDYVAYREKVIQLTDGEEIVLHIDSIMHELDTTLIDTTFIRPVIKTRGVTHFQTNLDRNILSLHTAPRVGKMVQNIYKDEKYQFFVSKLEPDSVAVPKPSVFGASRYANARIIQRIEKVISGELPIPKPPVEKEKPAQPEVEKESKPTEENGKLDIDNYSFQTEFNEPEEAPRQPRAVIKDEEVEQPREVVNALKRLTKEDEIHRFRPVRIIPYRLKFRTDFVTTNLDNNLLFDGLNSFAGMPDEFSLPPPGILMKANFKDLLEDYQIEGGVRIPTTFNGAEYFLFMDDKKHRIDKRYAFYRRNWKTVEDRATIFPRRAETTTNIALTQWKYPFNLYKSLRATGTIRTDRFTPLATDATSLADPINREQRIGLKMEYVFDNTIDAAVNIKYGTRYKIFAETVKKVNVNISDESTFGFGEGFMNVIGFDARHYERILKYSVIAGRVAGATSFGSEKNLYYLGAVENWLFAKFDRTIPFPQDGNFAFQTIAANLRGFDMNIRNGNSFAVVNTEIRIPLFRYIWPRTRSSFFRNFQAVGFFDAGTAWTGRSPFNKENPINTIYLPDGTTPGQVPVTLKVNYFRDPLVAGYGYGVRMMILGYMLRVDYGYGIETRKVQKPKLYVSLGMDF